MDFGETAKTIWAQFVTVWNAPVPFLAALIASWFVMRWFIRGHYETRLANADSTVSLQERQIHEYKEKLSGATPDEAKARFDALENRLEQLSAMGLGGRRISQAQRDAMVGILEIFRGATIEIIMDGSAGDMILLHKDFTEAFSRAGWLVCGATVTGVPSHPPTGLALGVRNAQQLTPEQSCIERALKAAGIPYDLHGGARLRAYPDQAPPVANILLTTRLD